MSSKRPAEHPSALGDNYDSQPQQQQRKRQARRAQIPKVPPPVYSATVSALAEQAGTDQSNIPAAGLDEHVIARIRKCLDRANHPNTPESEAKAALHLASKLMGQHNVTQAEILAHVPASERGSYAGQSTVTIQRVDGDLRKLVKLHAYQSEVAYAMRVFFDCKYYTRSTSRGGKVIKHSFTFYGLADNTVAAAMAFETAINLIEKWCMRYKGGDRKSYVLGVASELTVMAREEAAAEAKSAREADRAAQEAKSREEEEEKQSQLDRLASLPLEEKASGAHPASVDCLEENEERKPNVDRIHDEEDDPVDNHDSASANVEQAYSDWDGFSDDVTDETEEGRSDEENEDYEDYGNDHEGVKADFNEEEGRCYIDLTLDIDEEIQNLVKREASFEDDTPWYGAASSSIKPEPSLPGNNVQAHSQVRKPLQESSAIENASNEPNVPPQEIERRWESHMQLVIFRDMAQTIADNYLKNLGQKVRKGRARQRNVSNWDAFREGVADGRKIDVKRNRIEG